MPNLKFLALFVPEILFKIPTSGSRNPHVMPIDIILHLSLVFTAFHLCAKFEVSSFYRSGVIMGSQNSKSGSRDTHMTPFDLILHFFRWYSLPSISVHNLKFLASFILEILGGRKNPKLGQVTPHDSFRPYFVFFSIILTAIHMCAKFEVSSIIRPRYISGFQNSKK